MNQLQRTEALQRHLKGETMKPATIGVFLYDTTPVTLWHYLGVNASGEHVFDTGTIAAGNFKVKHSDTLDDFWPLTLGE